MESRAAAFLDRFAVRIYEYPLLRLRHELPELPEVLRNVVLVVDFNTEIIMQGLLGFLENSTGQFLPETIIALRTIGAFATAHTLCEVQDVLASSQISTRSLHDDLQKLELFQITTFRADHPQVDAQALDAIAAIEDRASTGESEELLLPYVAAHLEELEASLSLYESRYAAS
jgi:hypothetical protein